MHSEFYTAAQKDFVLVSLDFPQGEEAKAAVPNPKRNDELMAKYGVQGFPTVMIVNAQGDGLGQTGYKDMDPADYLADVIAMRDAGKMALVSVRELKAEFAAAEDKVAVAVRAASELAEMEMGTPTIGGFAAIVRQGIALTEDPAIQIALLKPAVAMTGATEDDKKRIAELDPSNEHGLMQLVVFSKMNTLESESDLADLVAMCEELHATGTVVGGEETRILYVSCAFFCNEYLEDEDGAKTWAQRAVDLGGLDERMQEVIDGILNNPFEDDSDF
ncbi:MAG TPA: thioredoxin family protein [Planctomycetes bacterium]|nr:thioredoxin family protein [Planctomycetota bacterium]